MTLTPARRLIAIFAVIALVVGGILAALSWVRPFDPGVNSGPFSAAAISSTAAAKPRVLLAPFPAGQTWYVCTGYDIDSHNDVPDLDLVYSKKDIKGDRCIPGATSSTGKKVVAPANGRVSEYWRPDLSSGSICFNFDTGGSMMFSHLKLNSKLWLKDKKGKNPPVSAGATIGTVEPPVLGNKVPRNNNVAHLHLSAYASKDCAGNKVPFAQSAGMRLTCARNLTDGEDTNQWASQKITSCPAGKLGGMNMQKACDLQYPDQGRKAKVTKPTDAGSWRCISKTGDEKSIDVARECRFEYAQTASAKVADSRNPYSWYCLR